jgi:pilus assembly protein Flp/PilA
MSKFIAFLNDESGASAAEYVLILAIIGTTVAGAMVTFGNALGSALGRATSAISGYTY